jgi:hypothetical protein
VRNAKSSVSGNSFNLNHSRFTNLLLKQTLPTSYSNS